MWTRVWGGGFGSWQSYCYDVAFSFFVRLGWDGSDKLGEVVRKCVRTMPRPFCRQLFCQRFMDYGGLEAAPFWLQLSFAFSSATLVSMPRPRFSPYSCPSCNVVVDFDKTCQCSDCKWWLCRRCIYGSVQRADGAIGRNTPQICTVCWETWQTWVADLVALSFQPVEL